MRLFMMSLTEEARDWFNGLPNASINSIANFQNQFLEQYGNQCAPEFSLHELISIQKYQNELVYDFNQRFSKLYNKIPQGSKLTDLADLSIYFKAFDPKIGYELKKRCPRSLTKAQKTTLIIENNRKVVGMTGKRDNLRFSQNSNNPQNKQENLYTKKHLIP